MLSAASEVVGQTAADVSLLADHARLLGCLWVGRCSTCPVLIILGGAWGGGREAFEQKPENDLNGLGVSLVQNIFNNCKLTPLQEPYATLIVEHGVEWTHIVIPTRHQDEGILFRGKMICFRSNRSRVLHFIKFSNGHQFPTWPCKVLCNCVSVHLCVASVSVCSPAVLVLLSPDRRLRFVSEFMLEKPDEIFLLCYVQVKDLTVC